MVDYSIISMKETGLFNVLYGPVNESWLIIVLYINIRNRFVYCTIWACE